MDLSSSDRILHDLRSRDAELEEHVRSSSILRMTCCISVTGMFRRILQRVDDIDIATVIKGKSHRGG